MQGKNEPKQKDGGPGPGQYRNPDYKAQVNGITFKGDKDILGVEVSEVPGPGYYYLIKPSKSNGVTIGKRFPEKERDNIPGPGRYNPSTSEALYDKAPEWTMNGKLPQAADANNIPGPGQYGIPDNQDKGVSFTMRGRHGVEYPNENPGPGYYNVKPPKPHDGFSLGGKIIIKEKIEDIPGPGEYNAPNIDTIKEKCPNWTIPSKYAEKENEPVPGPGHYKIPELDSPNRGIAMKGNKNIKEIEDNGVPGPGHYKVIYPKNEGGLSILEKHPDRVPDNFPGPGSYNYKHMGIDGGPKWTFNERIPDKEIEEAPGPGAYKNPDYKDNGIAYTIGGKHNIEYPNEYPGPGHYNVKVPKGRDGPTLKGKIIIEEKFENIPGPGNYNIPSVEINHDKIPSYTIPQSNPPDKNENNNPGPGHYRYPSPNDGRKGFTIPGRLDTSKERFNENPGPGTYNIKNPKGYAITIGEKPRDRDPENIPGPGHYNNPIPDINRERMPKWTISERPPQKHSGDNYPGPGNYSNINDGPGISYTIGGRHDIPTNINIPGPGTYNIKNPKKGGITIGTKTPLGDKPELKPGPGNYNSKSSLTQIGYTIGKGSRKDGRDERYPGPGSYNDKRKGNPYKGRFSKSKRSGGKPSITPGPGSYNIKPIPGKEGPKIQNKYPERNKNNTPGPNYYKIGEGGEKGPAFTIGVKRRKRSVDSYPGPNHYSLKYKMNDNNSPRCTIGRSGRTSRSNKTTIGPGHYNFYTFIQDGPSISMGQKLKRLKGDEVPGPGMYNIIEKPMTKKKGPKTPKRVLKSLFSTPGPGHYNISGRSSRYSSNKKSIKVSKSGRKLGCSSGDSRRSSKTRTKFETPGPAHYHIPTWKDSTGRSILERHNQKLKENNPGPGMYDISLYTPKGLSFTISGSSTIDYEQKSKIANPPPNSYHPKYSQISNRVTGGSIGRSKSSKSRKSESPGPSHYSVYDANGNKRKGITIGERFKPGKFIETPGPSHYKPYQSKKKKENRTIGKSVRITHTVESTPGVGSYNLGRSIEESHSNTQIVNLDEALGAEPGAKDSKKKKSKPIEGISFPKAAKTIISVENQVPGPGHYSEFIDKMKVNEKPAAYKERFSTSDNKENMPAPGQYTVSQTSKNPSFTFPKSKSHSASKSKERENDRFYDIEQSHKVTQQTTIKTSIGKSTRKDDKIDNTPAPGYYNLYNLKCAKKGITIGEKFKEKDQGSTPGPGAYKPQWDCVDVVYTNDIKFGTANKMNDEKQTNYPAPGYYNIEGKLDKGVKIGTSQRSEFEALDTPAPNHYSVPSLQFNKKCGKRNNQNKFV